MPPTNATEEIIEKKTGSPIATACLILAAVALLGSIALQITEIADYRKGNIGSDQKTPGATKAKKDTDAFRADVENILNRKAPGADAAPTLDEGKTKPDEAKKADEPKEGDDAKAEDTKKADGDEKKPDEAATEKPAADKKDTEKKDEPAEEK